MQRPIHAHWLELKLLCEPQILVRCLSALWFVQLVTSSLVVKHMKPEYVCQCSPSFSD